MSTLQSVYSTLRQEGYQPLIDDNGALNFKYYGQPALFRTKTLQGITIGELECELPRPAPEAAVAEQFSLQRPLCRLTGRGGKALLVLETMLTERDVNLQLVPMLRLLDRYSADFIFGGEGSLSGNTAVPPEGQATAGRAEAQEKAAQVQPAPAASVSESSTATAGTSHQTSTEASSEPLQVPPGWEEVWKLLNVRFQPLAQALAQQGAPVPSEVQMDMLQGNQVRGTAIMMWGTPPDAVVVCEQGQVIPAGYQGANWYRHQNASQIAQETLAYLKAARLV